MAIIKQLVCPICGEVYTGVKNSDGSPYDNTCSKCLKTQENIERKQWFLERHNGKTIEQRIAWIEEWIYQQKNHTHGYTPPPRF